MRDSFVRRTRFWKGVDLVKSARTLISVSLAVAFVLSGCSANGGSVLAPFRPASAQSSDAVSGKHIKHIVLMIQENRSFDNFFATFPGADGATYGYTSKGVKIELKKSPLPAADINHDWSTFVAECDRQGSVCKMDGFDKAKIGGDNPGGTYAYQYVDPTKIKPYWAIAQQYALLDHMFQTQGSGSFTAHQDLIAGATAIDDTNSLIDYPSEWKVWGCDAPKGTTVPLITVSNQYIGSGKSLPFPCVDYKTGTMRDLLDAKSVSWKYYVSPYHPKTGIPAAGSLWNAFAAIKSVRYGPEWTTNVSIPQTNVCNDVNNGTLPAVSWVIPDQVDSDHPRTKDGTDTGPDWIASVVNKIGKSPYWNSTAIVIVWDDWGGFFDHVPPKLYGSGQLGFRVPALIVSPYVAKGKIAQTDYEFGSILKFVEQTFGLGSLGTTDVRATSIANAFAFSKRPRSFTPIPTNRTCDYFIRRGPSYQALDTE